MTRHSPGIRFHETMAGPLMRGEQDYRQGERLGRSAGEILTMHTRVAIDDMAAFMSDPAHPGSLSGSIDYPPFARGIAFQDGQFNLFSPGDDPRLKLMVYKLGFVHAGKEYFLAGHKAIRDDPGFDMWRDTTTLFTRLHEGRDDSGAVIAAGVLSLGMVELTRLVASMEVLNAASMEEKAACLASFGRFFLGELWDSYLHHSPGGGAQ